MPKKLFSTATLNTPSTIASSNVGSSPLVPATFTDGLPLPRLFVFDLDYTLWPFWVDTHVSSPVKPSSKDSATNTAMIDAHGESFSFYREVPGILYAARRKGISMGLASRTCAPDLAGVMLRNIVIPIPPAASQPHGEEQERSKDKPLKSWDYFRYREIYPGSKINHFEKIHAATKKKEPEGEVEYSDMVFFDDESRNRDVERKHGVTFVLVSDGVTRAEIDRGVRDWRKKKGIVAQHDSNLDNHAVELE